MTATIEPGFYEPGRFGVRVESDFVVEDQTPAVLARQREVAGGVAAGESYAGAWLGFRNLTAVPLQAELFAPLRHLSPAERRWLNDHQRDVLRRLRAHWAATAPPSDPDVEKWVESVCQPVPELDTE
jgi:hypothetical protein